METLAIHISIIPNYIYGGTTEHLLTVSAFNSLEEYYVELKRLSKFIEGFTFMTEVDGR